MSRTRRDFLRIGISVVGAVVGAGALGAEPAAALAASPSPDGIRGIKWRGAARPKQPGDAFDTLTVRFDTAGLSYGTAAASLRNNGFGTVVLRVANMTDLPAGTTRQQRDDEVIKLLRELHRRNMNVYLWKRQWLQRGDVAWGRYPKHPGADEFIADMSRLIQRAKSEGLTRLQGVMPAETNLENTAQVRERALYIAKGINAATGDWLKNHTFMVPGCGNGAFFTNIHQGGRAWLANMKAQTGHFAFTYKHMPSHDTPICSLGKYKERWNYYVGYRTTRTIETQIKYLRQEMGLSDLEYYMRWGRRNGFPDHTHVVFWGDVNEGIYALSALDDDRAHNYNTARALHRLLVQENHWHGYFLDLPFTAKDTAPPQIYGYMLTVDRKNGDRRARNTAQNRSGTHTVWWEWHNWANENAAF